MSSMKILTLYTSTGCTQCLAVKKWLGERSVHFVEKNLSDTSVMSELVMSDVFIMSAPALEVNGRLYTVDEIFDDGKLNEELLEQSLGLS